MEAEIYRDQRPAIHVQHLSNHSSSHRREYVDCQSALEFNEIDVAMGCCECGLVGAHRQGVSNDSSGLRDGIARI